MQSALATKTFNKKLNYAPSNKSIQLKSFISKELFLRPILLAAEAGTLIIPFTLEKYMLDHLELLEEMYSDIYRFNVVQGKDNKLIEFIKKELNIPIIVFNKPLSGPRLADRRNPPERLGTAGLGEPSLLLMPCLNKISSFSFIWESWGRSRAWPNYERVKDIDIYPKIGVEEGSKTGIYIYFLESSTAKEKIERTNHFNPLKCCYIGSSKDILKRDKAHIVRGENKCKIDNVTHKLILGQIYATVDYLAKFKKLYPLHKLSKGEWMILNQLTEFYLKILEQSLIRGLKAGLNKQKCVRPKYFGWQKEWVNYYDDENKYKKIIMVKVFQKVNSLRYFFGSDFLIDLLLTNGENLELFIKEIPISKLIEVVKNYTDAKSVWKNLDNLIYFKSGLFDSIRIQSKAKIEHQPVYIQQKTIDEAYYEYLRLLKRRFLKRK